MITSLIQKASLLANNLKNYHSVSGLSFTTKLAALVLLDLSAYFDNSVLGPCIGCLSYRTSYSTRCSRSVDNFFLYLFFIHVLKNMSNSLVMTLFLMF